MEAALTVLIWLIVGILGFYAVYIVAVFFLALLMLIVFSFKNKFLE